MTTWQKLRLGELDGSYSRRATNALHGFVRDRLGGMKNKRVLVIGSERPWVEVIALEQGASQVVTLEYGKIQSKHTQLKPLTPSKFSQMYWDGTLGSFDVVMSFSSLEHSGLTRYGDGLNPWGDVIAMAKAHCVVKEGGIAVIGVPDRDTGRSHGDAILFPFNRIYSRYRLPVLLTNWDAFEVAEGHHAHVLVAARKLPL